MKRFFAGLAATALAVTLGVTASAAELAAGVTYEKATTEFGGGTSVIYTVEADASRYEFAIATHGSKAATIGDMTAADGENAVAVINGDHFSFQTGIPMGMSASQGRLITSPIEAYDADGYFFHVLGIMKDGTVKVGENPTMAFSCRIGDTELTIDRVNRTRETWVGGQIVLFTPDYGASTDTNAAGIEYVLDTGDAVLAPGQTIKATVKAVNKDNDTPLEEGTMVLSASLLCYEQIKDIAEGDEVEMTLAFEDESWNDLVFAVGGNRAIVEDGRPLPYDYAPGNFRKQNPRSALGVREDGTLVLLAVDGRSEDSAGMTANDTATYMAEELGCAYAILLDGGGSTAIAVSENGGELTTVNVPSDGAERLVGNAVMILEKAQTSFDFGAFMAENWWIFMAVAAVAAVTVAVIMVLKPSKND